MRREDYCNLANVTEIQIRQPCVHGLELRCDLSNIFLFLMQKWQAGESIQDDSVGIRY